MRIIVTRPEPDAGRTAQALAALGHEPILSPAIDIVFHTGVSLSDRAFQAVLVTSSNAVRGLVTQEEWQTLAGLPLLAVGDSTALEARRAGFRQARSAGGALADLIDLCRRELRPGDGPLLYAAGEAQAGDLAGQLAEHGFEVETVVLYTARQAMRLAAAAASALRLGEADAVLLYSRRSAAAFAAALKAEGLSPLAARVACLCLSAGVAEPLQGAIIGPALIASRPDQISLFALLECLPRG